MNIQVFLVQFPEFALADSNQVLAMLGAAALEIDVSVGTEERSSDKPIWRAAALSPFGQGAKLVAKDGTTTYLRHYQSLQRQVSSGFRVTN